ncbi:MAG: tRNA 2-thiouridine(34) synthase MnmA [Candidatus Spechtbacterales bacterium]
MSKVNKNTKVVVAMSGGVDSSVSATLLKEQGYDVVGVFMRCWNADDASASSAQALAGCTAEEDEYWARRAAQTIGIPFYSVDLVDEYKARVVDYFVSEYGAGRTPNPDVMCNNEIKFGVFYDKAINDFGADYMATGHYARISSDKGMIKLLRGIDKNKDQTYFLHRVPGERLARAMFPIGELPKPKVRELARKYNLPNSEKKDSQGLCFIGKVDVSQFLEEYIPQKPGVVVTVGGEEIGEHKGVQYYTIGQRKGVGTGGGGVPYYVVDKDIKENKLIVGTRYEDKLFENSLVLEDMAWINATPQMPLKVTASIRYRQEPEEAELMENNGKVVLKFKEPQRAVTPGQMAVIYKGEEVLGGGIIR